VSVIAWFRKLSLVSEPPGRTFSGYYSFAYSALACFRMGISGVGIFPEREEIVVWGFRLGGIACHGVGTNDLKADGRNRVVLAAVGGSARLDMWNVLPAKIKWTA
jgi:hypothetical protein